MEAVTTEARTWLGGSGNTVKRLDRSNGREETAVIETAAVKIGLGGDEMGATAAAQAWLVIRRRQQ